MKLWFIPLFILLSGYATARNDTLYLFKNFMVLEGKPCNLNSSIGKTGLWIDYILTEIGSAVTIAKDTVENCYCKIVPNFRPLAPDEFCGMLQLVEDRSDTVVNGIHCFKIFKSISNTLPPEAFQVLSLGNYMDDMKNGDWEYYHKNGQLAKRIHYSKGLPDTGFQILRNDGTISLEVKKLNDEIWEVCKYSDTLRKVGCKRQKIEEFKALY
jgi:hypothetical protein